MSQRRKHRGRPPLPGRASGVAPRNMIRHERPTDPGFMSKMNAYLGRYKNALDRGAFHPYTAALKESYDIRATSLIVLGEELDHQLICGVERIQGVSRERLQQVLTDADRGTRLTSKSPSLLEATASYFDETTGNVNKIGSYARVFDRIGTQGVDYIMKGTYGYNEEIAEDIEAFVEQLMRAHPEINEQLCIKSDRYQEVDEARIERPPNSMFTRKAVLTPELATKNHKRVLEKLKEALDLIKDRRIPIQIASQALLVAQNELMHHLGELGREGLEVIGKKRARNYLNAQIGDPLRQLETLLALLNTFIKDYKDLVLVYRNLLRQSGAVTGKYRQLT